MGTNKGFMLTEFGRARLRDRYFGGQKLDKFELVYLGKYQY